MPVLYIDVLLALNLFIDFLLLLGTARLLREPCRPGRPVLGAAVGALSCLTVLAPAAPAPLLAALRVGTAFLMVRAAFRFGGWRTYLRQVGVLFVLATVFAGVSFALYYFVAPAGFYVVGGVVYYDVSPLLLIALSTVSYTVILLYDRATRGRLPPGTTCTLAVTHRGRSVLVPAMHDTGSRLTEPFSGAPAAVLAYPLAKPLLPPELDAAVRHLLGLEETPPSGGAGLRMVPYTAIGGGGALPAFRPERMSVTAGGRTRAVTGAYIAICRAEHAGERAILGSDFLRDLNRREEHGHALR